MDEFSGLVYACVRRIPRGKVATYGQIAALVGRPRAARLVGYAMRTLPEGTDVPWWRVINSKGYISIENFEHPAEEQAALLRKEAIIVLFSRGIYFLDLKKYLWQP